MTPALLPLLPLSGAALVLGFRRDRTRSGYTGMGALLATLGVAAWLVSNGAEAAAWSWRPNMALGLSLDGFGRVMAILVPLIALPVAAYASAGEGDDAGPRLLAWILGFVAAMEILVLANDFLTLLIGWELVGACSWALIGYQWRDAGRPRAAAQAFLTTRFGDLGLYLTAAAAFTATGSLEFAALGGAAGDPLLHVVAAGVLVAAAAKSGQVPFAPWLFSAMSGPTPASALLHSATMLAAGAYALIRLWPWLEPVAWLGPATVGVGLATTLFGGGVAASHSDIKKALAGSTSSQYGLMFLAIGVGSPAAAGAQLVAHAAYKSLLFLGAGVAIHSVGSGRLDRMGLGRALPGIAVLVGVGALALAAVPPLGGAYSKEAILAAAVGSSAWLGAGVLTAGAVTAFYAFRIAVLAFGPGLARPIRRPAPGEVGGLVGLAVGTLLLSVFWLPGAPELIEDAVSSTSLVEAASWELAASLGALVLAGATCAALWRSGRLFSLGLRPALQNRIANWFGLPVAARAGIGRPTLRLAAALAHFDDRVVDAGVRGAASIGQFMSRSLSFWGELGADGVVEGIARLTDTSASASARLDDRRLDGTVEGLARMTAVAGERSRRLQSGLTHQYYTAIGAGLLVLIGVAILWR